MADRDREYYSRRLAGLEAQRRGWDVLNKDVQRYILPNHGYWADLQQPNEGESRQDYVMDSTAIYALDILAAGMQGGLTSPARPWFRLRLADSELMEHEEVRAYLDECTKRMQEAFASSNFYTMTHQLYTELAGFGTSVLYEEADDAKLFRFTQFTNGEYYLSEGPYGAIDTLFRKFKMMARNVVEQFGEDKCSHTVVQAAKTDPYQWRNIVMVVEPREQPGLGKRKDKLGMPWAAVYYENDAWEIGKDFLWEGGYEEFPFFCPRWSKTGPNVYGRSPGHTVLPDVKMLQSMTRTLLIALHKQVDPPILAPESMRGRMNMVPRGVTYTDNAAADTLRPLYEVRFDVQWTSMQIEKVERKIATGFFNDLFLMLLQKENMTATEVMERHEEKLLMLGPVIERQFDEFLNPCIDRTYNLMNRAGALPPPPQELQGMNLSVEYISILAQAQKMATGQVIRGTAGFVAELAAVNPEVVDKFDFDEAVDQYGEALGAPTKIIRSDDKVKKIREARAQAQAEALERERQTMEAVQAVDAAKKLSETQTGQSGNALADLAQSLGR